MYVTLQHKDKDGDHNAGEGRGGRVGPVLKFMGAEFDCKKYNNETSSSKLLQSLKQDALETKCIHSQAVRKTKFYNNIIKCPLGYHNSWTNR